MSFLFLFFHNLAYRSEFLDSMIVFFAVYFPFLVAIGTIIFMLTNRIPPLRVLLSSIGAFLLAEIIKNIMRIPRPFEYFESVQGLFTEAGFAFPSQHTMFFAALAGAVFFVNRKAGYVLFACSVLIGIARVAAGVHYPLDVLGGLLLGLVVAFLVNKVYNLRVWKKEKL